MYLKQQYLDYEFYKSNRLSDLYFNNAKELDDNFDNVEQTYGDIAILYHQALLINKNNIDSVSSLTKMIDDGKITAEQSTELRKIAFSKLKTRNNKIADLNIDDSNINLDLVDFTPPIFKFGKVTTNLRNIVQVEFNEPIKENNNISSNDFQVFINNNYEQISNVSVDSSGILLLHLSKDVRQGKTILIQYVRDLINTDNNVTDRNNNTLVSFGPVQIVNLVDTTPPYFTNGDVKNETPDTIELFFTESMNNNTNFDENTFTIIVGGQEVDIKNITINNNTILITLFNNIISTQSILISYEKTNDIFKNLTDQVGNELFSFTNQELINHVAPIYQSGKIIDDFPNKVFIDFDGAILSTTQFNTNDFSISVEGITVDISSIGINNEKNIEITLKNNVETNQTVILSYTKSNISSNNIVDENNNSVDTFNDKIIENLLAPIFDNGFVTNEVNNIITINFNANIKDISEELDLTTDFTLYINNQEKLINEISVQNGYVIITTYEYFSSMQSISIRYLKNNSATEKNLTNEIGIPIKSFTANIENRIAPVLIKKTVENDSSNNITLEFDVDVSSVNIKPENFQTNIKGYKYTHFPIVEYSSDSQSTLNIIGAQIVNGDVVLSFDGTVAAGAEGYVQYIDPGDNSAQKITDLCGNRLRTNSLIYPSYHPTEPYNWITNKVEPQLVGAEIVQYVVNEKTGVEYYQGIILKFNPHSIDNLSNAVSYEIFVNNANTSSSIDDNIFFETTNQRFTNSPQKTLLIIMSNENTINDTLSLKYYSNENNYINYSDYQKFIDYREYNMSEYNTSVDKLKVIPISDSISIINKLPPLFSSGEATNADFKRIILKFNSTLASKTISPGNFVVKINDISQNITEAGVFDNSNALYIKMQNKIPDESTIQVIYTRDTTDSSNNIQGIYQNDIADFDTETNIINTIDSTPPEILSLITTSPNSISMQLNEPLIENNINDDILNIHIDNVLADVSSVVIDSSNIQIVIHENITSMQNVTLTYDATQKDGPYVSDILGNVLHYPNPISITNTIPPVYTSSTTIYSGNSTNNKIIELSFDVDISQNTDTDLCGNNFDLTIDGVSPGINSISIVNGKVQITTSDNIVSMEDISFKYIQSGISTSHMKDNNGNNVVSFITRKTIQNTIPPFFDPVYPPRITNAEPFKIRIPFNVPLTNNTYNTNNLLPSSFSLQLYTQPTLSPTINSIDISNGDVILNYTTTNNGNPKINDLIVVSYTKPSNSLNQLKDDNGNSIENFGNQGQPILVEIEPELQTLLVADNEPSKIQLVFSPAFTSNNISDLCGNDFNITIDDVTPDISNIQLSNGILSCILSFELKQPIISNEVVQLQYIKPVNQINQFRFNNIRFSEIFYFESHESVLSVSNLVKPTFQSSIVRNDFFNKENEIFLTYNVDLSNNTTTINKDLFEIYDDADSNKKFSIQSVEIINNQIKIVLERDHLDTNTYKSHYIKEGATIVLKYQQDFNPDNSNKNIIDKNGNTAANLNIIIDNIVLTRPTFSSALATNGYDSTRLSPLLLENQITFTLNTTRDLSSNDICGNLINIFRQFNDGNNGYESSKEVQTVNTSIVNNGETADIILTLDASLNWYQHFKYNYFNDSNFIKNIIDVSNIMVESFETGEYETDNIVINIHPTISVSGEFNTEDKTYVVSSIDTEQKRIAFYDKNNSNNTFNQRIEYFQQTYKKEYTNGNVTRKKKFKIHPYPIDTNTPDYSGAFIEPDQKNIIVLQFHEEIEPNADISKNTFVIDMSGRINNTIDLEHRPNIDISSLTIDSSGQIIIELMDDVRYLEQFSITYTKAGAGDQSILYDAQGNEAENFTNETVDVSRLPNDDPPEFYDFGFGNDTLDMYMPKKQVTQVKRHSHTTIYYDNKMVVFGGSTGSNVNVNDVLEFDLTTNVWKDISPSTGTKPNGRQYPTSIYYNNKMVVFGGYSGSSYKNDVWEFDLTTNIWKNISPSTGTKPNGRAGHTSIYYNNKMVVFGGSTDSSYKNDVWEFDLTDNSWNKINDGSGDDANPPTAPNKRHGHASIYYNNKMVVFGGYTGSNVNDVWEFDLTTNVWKYISPSTGTKPNGRRYHTSIYYNNKMVVFGGSTDSSYKNDVWEFDLTDNSWNKINDGSGDDANPPTAPNKRHAHTSIYYNNKMVVFGGYTGGGRVNDVWEFNLTTNTWRDIGPPPPIDIADDDSSPFHISTTPLIYSNQTIQLHTLKNNYNNLEILIVNDTANSAGGGDNATKTKNFSIYGKNSTSNYEWDFSTPHQNLSTSTTDNVTESSYTGSKRGRFGIDICNNLFVVTSSSNSNHIDIFYYEGFIANKHKWNETPTTITFDDTIHILLVSGKDMFVGRENISGLLYYTMKSNYKWPTDQSEYIDIIAPDLQMRPSYYGIRKLDIYNDTLAVGSLDIIQTIKRNNSLEYSNFVDLNKVRFYKKNNNNLFDNTYTEYTLGHDEMVNVRFALYKDTFTWVPAESYTENINNPWKAYIHTSTYYWDVTNKIGIMKKDKKTNRWPSIVDLSNNKNYNLITLNIDVNNYHYNVYLNDDLVYLIKKADTFVVGSMDLLSQHVEGIYKVITDNNGKVNIEQDSNNEYINYRPDTYNNINLSIAHTISRDNNSNFVSNYLFYIEDIIDANPRSTKYKMITMNKSGTYDMINTKEISLEFTKDLSLNDLCGNDFILTDLTGENTLTMTNLELENNKFINLTFQDKIYTTENINIEYIQNTDPTFAITETLYNNPLTNFQHVLDAPFITSKVINRDNSNNIVITFNEDIDYNIAITNNVNISFNYKSTISGSDTPITYEKDISKNIITITPNATVPLDLTNNYKYIVRYRQVTDNDYNLKNNNNNKVNNFSVEFDFL